MSCSLMPDVTGTSNACRSTWSNRSRQTRRAAPVSPSVESEAGRQLVATYATRSNGGRFMLKRVLMLSILLVAPAVPTSAASERPSLHFRVFARTGIRLTDVVWTGTQFLYVENTTNAISAAGPAGTPVHAFASLLHM